VTAMAIDSKQASLRETVRAFWAWARTPLFIAVASRIALWLFAFMGLIRHPIQALPGTPPRAYLDGWFMWDAGWYMNIVRTGYSLTEINPGQRNTVFFPLYPMLTRAMSWLPGIDDMWAAFLVSNLAFVAAATILYRFVLERWDRRTAENTVLLLATAPHAFYFSACYTESVFLLTWVGAFYAAHRKNWLVAGIFVALSGATRLVGSASLAGVGLLALEQAGWRPTKLSPRVLWLSLGALGLGGYMAFLWASFGDPWLFAGQDKVAGWGLGHDVADLLFALRHAFDLRAWADGKVRLADVTHLYLLILGTCLALVSWKRIGVPLTLFSLLALAVYWKVWFSSSRYVLTLFPLYISVALSLRRQRLAMTGLLCFDALLLGHHTWLYNHRDWVS